MPVWRLAFAILGNTTLYALLSLQIPVLWSIWKHKSTEERSGSLVLLVVLVSLLWLWYALPFIGPVNIAILSASGAAAAVQAIFICLFLAFGARNDKSRFIRQLVALVLFLSTLVTVTSIAVGERRRRLVVGLLCASFSVVLYAFYHISAMKHVLANKAVNSNTLLLSLLVFVNSVTWTIYGICYRNKFILAPTGLGSFMGVGQLVSFLVLHGRVWRDPPPQMKSQQQQQRHGLPAVRVKNAAGSDLSCCGMSMEFDAVLLPT